MHQNGHEWSSAVVGSHPAVWASIIIKDYIWAPHIKLISKALIDIHRGECDRLIIETPPRHGKSLLTSIAFPGWYLGINPDKRVITASHTATLAQYNSRQIRNSLASHGSAYFGIQVAKDSAAVDRWGIEGHSGGLLATGIGGACTGFGADLFCIDDPVKDAEQAYSKTQRDKMWEWYTTVARTRLHPGAAMVIIATRWREDDLIGRVLASGVDEWRRIRLPAIAEPDDMLGREVGEALWPERYPVSELEKIRKELGSYRWSALYQQRPTSYDGDVVKRDWIRSYSVLPDKCDRWLQSWDLSFSESGSSFVVGQIWATDGVSFYLVDQYRRRSSFVDTLDAIRMMTHKWPQATAKLIEDKANGPAVMDVLKRELSGVVSISPKGSKESRLMAVQPLFEAGNVFVPKGTDWVDDYIEELCGFPKAPADDQVDATSMALNRFRKAPSITKFSIGSVNTRESPWVM